MKIARYISGLVLALICMAALPAGAQERAAPGLAVTGFGDRPVFAVPHPAFEDPMTAEAAAQIAPAGGAVPTDSPAAEDDARAAAQIDAADRKTVPEASGY